MRRRDSRHTGSAVIQGRAGTAFERIWWSSPVHGADAKVGDEGLGCGGGTEEMLYA